MTSQALFQAFGPRSPGPLCLSSSVSIFSSHIMDRRCCEMTVGKGVNPIWKDNNSFVIISRKGDLVHLFCEDFVMMTPNHIHRSQLLSSWK